MSDKQEEKKELPTENEDVDTDLEDDITESILNKEEQTLITEFLDYLNHSITPYHAVEATINILNKNGFKKLSEKDGWKNDLKPGHYYFTRGQATIIFFSIPENYKHGNGFTIMGGHTDSPCFRVKPKSKKSAETYLQVGIEKYGGGLWHTWFDRDLSVAGRVLIKESKNKFTSKLVRINRPILRIPTLAIHLDREVVENGFKYNTEDETLPIFATEIGTQLNKKLSKTINKNLDNGHHSLLINILSKKLGCKPGNINDFELYLYDTKKSCQGGALNEFIYSGRLDNLCSCFMITKSFINSIKSDDFKNETNIRMAAFFDNEEVGSRSNRGAASNILLSTIKRIAGVNIFQESISKSILISCDMAHGVHPNYISKHETNHKPHMHKGTVIKYNCNQNYATTMLTTYHLIECAKKLNLPIQKFMVKNNTLCGSTIGPILASICGIRTIDIGLAQLSMHSIREVCGVKDICYTIKLLTYYYNNFVQLDGQLDVD